MVDAAISAAKSAAQYLGRLAVDEASFLYGVKGKVEELHDELMWMQVFLEDVDTRFGNKDKLVDLWVSQIYDFSYDAEDTIDKYIHRVLRKRKEGIWDTIKWFCVMSCSISDAKTLHEVSNEIDALTQKIAKLTSRMQLFKIEPRSRENSSSSASLMMESTTTNSLHHFRQPFVSKEWINKLAYGGRVVLSGPTGSGKTTLALATYSDKDVIGDYAFRIWIHVGDRYSIYREVQPRIFSEDLFASGHHKIFSLIQSLFDDGVQRGFPSDLIDREISEVQTYLKMKRCLVVLDNVPDDVPVEAWSALERAFHSIADITCRSQLLVIMRDGEIASSVGGTLHKLEVFADDDVWYLLGEKTGITKHSAGNDEKKSLLKAMLPKCCGRPSLIAQLGGILSSLDDINDWQTVKKGLGTDVVEDYEGCLRRMNEMSYRFLPKHLKPLIIYLAMLPEGYPKIRAKKLYRWWTAEGIITTKGEDQVSREELAEGYLCELVNRGLVQLAGPVKEETGKIETVKLQDSMRDLCLEKATKDRILNVVRSSSINTGKYGAPNSRSIRRLAIHMDEELQDYYRKHADKMSEEKAPYVRSLLLFVTQEWEPEWVKKWIKSMSNNYPALRVLIMDYAAGKIRLPKEIGNFIHLRVLSFKGCDFGYTKYRLPSTISNLRSLEILDLRVDKYCCIVIPNVFPSLKQLTHLYLPLSHWAPAFDKFQLDGLIHLKTLKNLDLQECREQVLSYSAEELRRVLVPWTVRKKDYLKLKNLVTHPRIRSRSLVKPLALMIHGDTFAKDADVLSGCNSLDRLTIREEIRYDIFTKVVQSLESLQNLSELELMWTSLNEDPMPVLGKLPKLKILRLAYEAYLGKDMVIHASANEFPQLTHLHIDVLNLECFSAEEGVMPNLLELRISVCQKLKTIGGTFPNLACLDLKYLDSLQKWTVVERTAECTKLDTEGFGEPHANIREKNIPEGLPPTVKIYYCSPDLDDEELRMTSDDDEDEERAVAATSPDLDDEELRMTSDDDEDEERAVAATITERHQSTHI